MAFYTVVIPLFPVIYYSARLSTIGPVLFELGK